MSTRRITPVRRVGSVVAVATFAVAGVAGCASGDSRTQSDRDQQATSRQVDGAKRPIGKSEVAKAASAYCASVDSFNGALISVPDGKPSQVQGSLDKLSDRIGRIVRAAPDDVRDDWQKLHGGFDRLNQSYDLLDGIDEDVLADLQSASTESEVNAIELRPKEAKQYERFQKNASRISADVQKSGKKVSEQVQKECDISIGE